MSNIPSLPRFYLPVMEALGQGATNAKTALPSLRRHFGFDDADMAETILSGTRLRVFDRADWAIFHLMKAGLVDRPARGVYELSAEGHQWLAAGKGEIDCETLRRFPKYQAFKAQSAAKRAESETDVEATDQGTPHETLGAAFDALTEELVSELRAMLVEMSPARFEDVIVDLLIAMGYGGGDPGMGRSIGKSGDGGIDGIINEDALGLDAVYVQAKRYAVENKVGRPAIQAFVGSLTGESATKGVFVTTSDFSGEARAYVDRVQQRIVLIDGDRLARLMIRHEVGVRARRTYVLRSVDEDYFADTAL